MNVPLGLGVEMAIPDEVVSLQMANDPSARHFILRLACERLSRLFGDCHSRHDRVTVSTASFILAMAKWPTVSRSICGRLGISSGRHDGIDDRGAVHLESLADRSLQFARLRRPESIAAANVGECREIRMQRLAVAPHSLQGGIFRHGSGSSRSRCRPETEPSWGASPSAAMVTCARFSCKQPGSFCCGRQAGRSTASGPGSLAPRSVCILTFWPRLSPTS